MILSKGLLIAKFGIIGMLVIANACSGSSNYSEEVAVENTAVTEDYKALEKEGLDNDTAIENDDHLKDLKIIKSAKARYKVVNVRVATDDISKLTSRYQGYISDMRFQNNLRVLENRFTLKVPQQHFDALLDSIHGLVEFIEYENITTEDVTEEYVDVETRLKTKIEVKERYEDILRSKAKTVKEVLQTEEKLRKLQEEIESAQGRLKYMSNRVAFSTIQIDLYEEVEYTEKPETFKKSFGTKMQQAFAFGWDMIKSLFLGIIYLWPIILLIPALIYIYNKKFKK